MQNNNNQKPSKDIRQVSEKDTTSCLPGCLIVIAIVIIIIIIGVLSFLLVD